MTVIEKSDKLFAVTPDDRMALKNGEQYAMGVTGVNIDGWIECPKSEYDDWMKSQEINMNGL